MNNLLYFNQTFVNFRHLNKHLFLNLRLIRIFFAKLKRLFFREDELAYGIIH